MQLLGRAGSASANAWTLLAHWFRCLLWFLSHSGGRAENSHNPLTTLNPHIGAQALTYFLPLLTGKYSTTPAPWMPSCSSVSGLIAEVLLEGSQPVLWWWKCSRSALCCAALRSLVRNDCGMLERWLSAEPNFRFYLTDSVYIQGASCGWWPPHQAAQCCCPGPVSEGSSVCGQLCSVRLGEGWSGGCQLCRRKPADLLSHILLKRF